MATVILLVYKALWRCIMKRSFPSFYVELPYLSDSSIYFEAVRCLSWPIFLDSANTNYAIGRYDIIAADPFIKLETLGTKTDIHFRNGKKLLSTDDPFDLLQQILNPIRTRRG